MLADRKAQVRAEFIARRGFWAPAFQLILDADHEFLSAYVDFSSAPWERGVLPPKVKELVYVAADAAVTHLHRDGTRSHIRSALRHGATPAEIVAVLKLVSLVGLQSLDFALPLLSEEAADAAVAAPIEAEAMRAAAFADPALEPRIQHLVCLAVDASTTHLYEAGARQHIRAALAAGATPAEIVEVLELVSVLGIHSLTMAAPVLAEEVQSVDN